MHATRSTICSTLCTKTKKIPTSHEYTITIPTVLLLPIWPSLSETRSNSKMVSVPRRYFFFGSFMGFLVVFFVFLCLLCLCARLFICALWSPAGKGLTSWLSFVVSNCEFVTFPLVFWVRCGT